MQHTSKTVLFSIGLSLVSLPVHAAPASLSVTSSSIKADMPIPDKFAFCTSDGRGKTKPGGNISPQLSWSVGPVGTKSYAVIVVDPDVPESFDNANKAGKTIDKDADRQNFYHWSLLNIPASITSLPEGAGKGVPDVVADKMEWFGWPGVNDYASFMKDKPAQTFLGYDGPCPPWNDARTHHYHFTVYALDTEKVMYFNDFTGKNAMDAIEKHILAKGELVGTFTTNK